MFTITVGSYDKLIYGFVVDKIEPSAQTPSSSAPDNQENEHAEIMLQTKLESRTLRMQPIFEYPAHVDVVTCITSVAAGGGEQYMATGGQDEYITVYSQKHRQELIKLLARGGTVTCLKFYKDQFLLSGSHDGSIFIWRCKDWELVLKCNAHKASVNDFCIHPTGRALISVSQDKTFKMFSLLNARCVFSINLGFVGTKVTWSPSTDTWAVIEGSNAHIYSTAVCYYKTIGSIGNLQIY